jgi:hypothetical protein
MTPLDFLMNKQALIDLPPERLQELIDMEDRLTSRSSREERAMFDAMVKAYEQDLYDLNPDEIDRNRTMVAGLGGALLGGIAGYADDEAGYRLSGKYPKIAPYLKFGPIAGAAIGGVLGAGAYKLFN